MKKTLLILLGLATSFGAWAQDDELWDPNSTIILVETWAEDGDCVASCADGTVYVTIGSQASCQWGNQVKLLTNINFKDSKQYDISFTATASQEVVNVTLKVDDNTGIVFEDQTITIDEFEGVNYTIKNVDGKPGNSVWAFDFGWAEAGTTIELSDFSVIEHEPVAVGLPDVNPSATVSASSGIAANAIDDDLNTRWESNYSNNQWWCVNYGSQKEMDNIKITWEAAYGSTFKIYGSNDCSTWDEIAFVEDQVLDDFPYVQVIPLDGTKQYQYVLFRGGKRGTEYGYSFWEFETYKAVVTDYTRTVTAGNFGTICLPKATSAVSGATFYNIAGTVKTAGDISAVVLEEVEGQLEAGKPYLFKATDATLTATYTGEAVDEPIDATGLVGNLSSLDLNVPTGAYIIYGNALRQLAGATATVAQNRAYIDLDGVAEYTAGDAKTIAMDIWGETTGINAVTATDAAEVFNFQGQKVNASNLPQGVYVKNGRKFIVK